MFEGFGVCNRISTANSGLNQAYFKCKYRDIQQHNPCIQLQHQFQKLLYQFH